MRSLRWHTIQAHAEKGSPKPERIIEGLQGYDFGSESESEPAWPCKELVSGSALALLLLSSYTEILNPEPKSFKIHVPGGRLLPHGPKLWQPMARGPQ